MLKVFLVDDEEMIRTAFNKVIDWDDEGFEYLGNATDGESALPVILQKKPDILITDICMPFMNGLELIRIVKKELPNTIVIILSGHDEFSYAQKAIDLGVNDYILKPLTPIKLTKALVRASKKIEDENDKSRKKQSLEQANNNTQLQKETGEYELRNTDVLKIVNRDQIADILRFGSISDARNFVFKTVYENQNQSDMRLKFYIYDIIVTANIVAKEIGIELYQLKPFEYFVQEEKTNEALAEEILLLFNHIINERYKIADKTIQLVNKAKYYIDASYSSCDLSLGKVAAYINVSPNYLSTIFSKETKETFNEYLNKVRIKNAMLLLKLSDNNIADIAEKTGFNDQHYFSKAFKKIVGISPREYKKL